MTLWVGWSLLLFAFGAVFAVVAYGNWRRERDRLRRKYRAKGWRFPDE